MDLRTLCRFCACIFTFFPLAFDICNVCSDCANWYTFNYWKNKLHETWERCLSYYIFWCGGPYHVEYSLQISFKCIKLSINISNIVSLWDWQERQSSIEACHANLIFITSSCDGDQTPMVVMIRARYCQNSHGLISINLRTRVGFIWIENLTKNRGPYWITW